MSTWKCDTCDTNNALDAGKCRNCTGTTRKLEVPKIVRKEPAPPPVTEKPQPPARTSRVRGTTVPTSVMPAPPRPVAAPSPPPRLAPAPVARPAPPPPPPRPEARTAPPSFRPPPAPTRPPAAPAYRPSRRRFWTRSSKRAARWIGGLAALVIFGPSLADQIGKISLPSGTSSAGGTSAGVACPYAAAQFLPGGGAGATLVKARQTTKHFITVCSTATGALFYDGQVKGKPADGTNHISLPATATASGCVARNLGYVYEVTGERVVVTSNGKVVLDEALQPV